MPFVEDEMGCPQRSLVTPQSMVLNDSQDLTKPWSEFTSVYSHTV